MPILDFKELAKANEASGEQDTFELFARDFFSYRGYSVLSGPDRGADAGRDLVVLETRIGVGGETKVKWLVSCKHKAHSGQSVTLTDETDIYDRIAAHQCDGFIGFYSTLPASGLTRKLEGLKLKYAIEVQIYDRERIESELLQSSDGHRLAGRFFPISFTRRLREQLVTLATLLRLTHRNLTSILAWANEIDDLKRSYRELIDEHADPLPQQSPTDPTPMNIPCFNDAQRAIVFDFEDRFKKISKRDSKKSVNDLRDIGLSIRMVQEKLLRPDSNKGVLAHELIAHLDELQLGVRAVVEAATEILKIEHDYQVDPYGNLLQLKNHLHDAIASIEEIKWKALDFVIEDATLTYAIKKA